jgi:hypothetical protein
MVRTESVPPACTRPPVNPQAYFDPRLNDAFWSPEAKPFTAEDGTKTAWISSAPPPASPEAVAADLREIALAKRPARFSAPHRPSPPPPSPVSRTLSRPNLVALPPPAGEGACPAPPVAPGDRPASSECRGTRTRNSARLAKAAAQQEAAAETPWLAGPGPWGVNEKTLAANQLAGSGPWVVIGLRRSGC